MVTPCNVKATKADEIKAKAILASTDNYIVRYLRDDPTVTLARIPVRDEHGAILVDATPARRRVICAGVPYGCMIAFTYDNNLRIGWSKRIKTQRFIESHELHKLFGIVIDEISNETGSYKSNFNNFCGVLSKLTTDHKPKEIEKPFSKSDGK